jgi:predicted lipoprotein with Yx(FWY)xxD motif
MMSTTTAGGDAPARQHTGRTRPHSGLAGLALLGAATALLAACGSTSASPASSSSDSSGSDGAVVSVATAKVNGSSEQVLTTSSGYTLYYLTQDSATSVTCTGSCAQTWPPLLLSSGQPTSSSSLPQALTTVTGGNGRQVVYDGHPLYHYSMDTGPDQSNGEDVDGVWFVATPSMGGRSATPTVSAASAPNGY